MRSWVMDGKKPRTHLLLEIGRARITAALLTVSRNDKKLVKNIWQDVLHIDEADLHDEGHRNDRYAKSLRGLLSRISKNDLRNLKKIVLVFDAPWGGSFWKDIKEEHKRPVKYTLALRNRLEKRAVSEYDAVSENNSNHKQTLLGLTPIHEKLNGYHFQESFGKRAEEIVATFQYDLVAEDVRMSMVRVIKEVLPHHKIETHTHDALLYDALRHFVHSIDRTTLFVFVDDQRTSLIIRSQKGAIEKRVVQIGLETVLEKIKKKFVKSHRQAQHMLAMYFEGTLEQGLQNEIMNECIGITDIWSKQLRQVMGQSLQDIELPERVVYTISDSFQRIVTRSALEKVVEHVLPGQAGVTFFDFRDNVLVSDGIGIVSNHVVHLYTATLL